MRLCRSWNRTRRVAESPDDVAAWMLGRLQRDKELYQQDAAYEISKRFGEPHVYENQSGNLAISRAVLAAFRALTEETAVWLRGERCWRLRERFDEPGRR